MNTLLQTLSSTLASVSSLGALALIGYPAHTALAWLAKSSKSSVGVSWVVGFFLASASAWKAFEAGIKLGIVYRGLLFTALAFIILRLALARRRPTRRDGIAIWRALGPDLVTFCACSASYAGLVHSNLAPGELAWPTILNADIFVYMKAAGYLGLFPGGTVAIGAMNLRDFAQHDVFGAFGLVTFGRFVLRTSWSDLPLSTMGLAIGLIGMAAGRCCRTLFDLGLPTSILLALVLVTGPLFQYVALNYFLGQMLFVGVLTTSSLWLVEEQPFGGRAVLAKALGLSLAAACLLLCYDVWTFQFVAITSGLLSTLCFLRPAQRWRDRLTAAVLSGLSSLVLAGASLFATSPSRLAGVASKLASFSVPNAAGWPLPFIDPGLLLGLPVAWRGMDDPKIAATGTMASAVLLLATVGIASAKLDRSRQSLGRKVVLALFCLTAAAYLVVWATFGETYQQWKFASTLPLGFGFAVTATVIHLLCLDLPPLRAAAAGAGAALFLTVCVVLNVSIAREAFAATLAHLPKSLKALTTVDKDPGNEPVYVDIDDFYPRMAALALINKKPLTFAGRSQFGPGSEPPKSMPYLIVHASCDPGEGSPIYRVDAVNPGDLPIIPLNRTISVSQDISGCLQMVGFGDPEPWGRRSVGRHASIRFDCGCNLAAGDIEIVLKAGGPDLSDLPKPQVAYMAVDDAEPKAFSLSAANSGELIVPVPPRGNSRSRIDLEIDLPDAASRPGAAPDDGKLFGLSLVSLEIRRHPRDTP